MCLPSFERHKVPIPPSVARLLTKDQQSKLRVIERIDGKRPLVGFKTREGFKSDRRIVAFTTKTGFILLQPNKRSK